jgi:hypothetical protein
VFRFNIISEIDLSIIVGIKRVHNFFSDKDNISTVPSTFTLADSEWTWAVDFTVSFTVGLSPFIFTLDEAFMDFTGINGTVIIGITVFS